MGDMKTRIVLLYAAPYRMADGGTVNEGVSVMYIYGDNLAAVQNNDGSRGQRAAKAVLPRSCWEGGSIQMVPGIYDGYFSLAVSKDNKPTLKLSDVSYVGECEVSLVKKSAPAPVK